MERDHLAGTKRQSHDDAEQYANPKRRGDGAGRVFANQVLRVLVLPAELVGPLFLRARTLEGVMEDGLGAQGAFVAVNNRVSQSVPHLHVHVVPRTRGDGLKGFFWPRTRYASDDDAQDMAARLAASYGEIAAATD